MAEEAPTQVAMTRVDEKATWEFEMLRPAIIRLGTSRLCRASNAML